MAPHSSTLAWKIPWMEEPGRLQSMGLLRVGHDWVTSLSLLRFGEGNGNPLQCSCLENPRDGGAWWAAVYGIAQSRTQLKRLSSSSSHSVVSDSLWPHGLQHARLQCPSPSPRVRSYSCPLSRWCHPTISSSGVPFSSCLQSFPASRSFPTSLLFASGGQSIGASASVLLMNIQGWFPLVLTGLISLQSRGLSRVFSSTMVWRHQFFGTQPFFGGVQFSYPYITTGKTIALTRQTFVGKVMSLLFNMLSRFFIAFLPRSKHLLLFVYLFFGYAAQLLGS